MCKVVLLALMVLSLPSSASYDKTGIASFYGSESGTHTANGERWNPEGLTAATWYLPFGTKVKVTNLSNGKAVVVRINDRGPNKRLKRLIDLSKGSARKIGLTDRGLAQVRVEAIG
jgi:rare lipoprotein A